MKYVNTGVVFQEIPDEVTLSINISNCPCHCKGCHSEYLWEDIGETLDNDSLSVLLSGYSDEVTCVCFMGGDAEPAAICGLASYVHSNYPKLKVAWYSGRNKVPDSVDKKLFDFIKVGPYIKEKGGLKSRITNQRLYRKEADGSFKDITSMFWK